MDVKLNLLSVKTKDVDSHVDIITDVNWEIVVTKTINGEEKSASMQLSSGMFEDAPEEEWVEYDDLTDDQILEWAKSQFDEGLLAEFILSLEEGINASAPRPSRLKVKS